MIEYLDELKRSLALILPKMRGYVKTFKDKGEDKTKSNILISLHVNNDKLLEKYKTVWTKIEDFKNI